MNSYKIFDINKPILSDEAEQLIQAKSAKEAIEKIINMEKNQYLKQIKGNRGGRFVVTKENSNRKTVYDIFNK